MPLGYLPATKPWTQEVHKTASYAVVVADSGTLFITDSGAVTYTLPTLALAIGGNPWVAFFINVSASAMIITAPANKFITDGNATGTTATYSNATHIIGSAALVFLNDLDTFFHLVNIGQTTVTIT